MDDLAEMKSHAESNLSPQTYGFIRNGAMNEQTLHDSEQAFLRYSLMQLTLSASSEQDLRVPLLPHIKHDPQEIALPIGTCPLGIMKVSHPDGEIAVAKAAEQLGTCCMISTNASYTIEDIAAAAPNAIKWLQLYVFHERNLTVNFVKRAEAAGYRAIVLTVDLPVVGIRIDELRSKFKPRSDISGRNFTKEMFKSVGVDTSKQAYGLPRNIVDSSLNWEDLIWLRSITKLPIILKGLVRGDDAALALKYKMDGIVVSTHGARQLDGAPATIDALAEVVTAVEGKIPVFLDGGVRSGHSVMKALALGATAVFVGRPLHWGLSWDGQQGVERLLRIFRDQLKSSMKRCGVARISDVNRKYISTLPEQEQLPLSNL